MTDKAIAKFIRRHHVMTLATVSADGAPYCANAFYACDDSCERLIFTSSSATRHAGEMAADSRVAASIVLETRIVGKIQGVQICGTATRGDDDDRRTYIRRFPYAAAAGELEIWRLTPDFIKFTDNTLGFGKKLIWTRN